MLSSMPPERLSVLAGPSGANANLEMPAPTSMGAASVETITMEPMPALVADDPKFVVTPLLPDAIEDRLRDLGILEDWQHIVVGLRRGFDTGADPILLHTLIFPNHSSSGLDRSFISSYIASEQLSGRYSRGYLPSDLEDIIGPFRTSPLGLVPKPHSDKFRLVQDLSYPRNNV